MIYKTYDFEHRERSWEEVTPEQWDHLPDSQREILYLQGQGRVVFVGLVARATENKA